MKPYPFLFRALFLCDFGLRNPFSLGISRACVISSARLAESEEKAR